MLVTALVSAISKHRLDSDALNRKEEAGEQREAAHSQPRGRGAKTDADGQPRPQSRPCPHPAASGLSTVLAMWREGATPPSALGSARTSRSRAWGGRQGFSVTAAAGSVTKCAPVGQWRPTAVMCHRTVRGQTSALGPAGLRSRCRGAASSCPPPFSSLEAARTLARGPFLIFQGRRGSFSLPLTWAHPLPPTESLVVTLRPCG